MQTSISGVRILKKKVLFIGPLPPPVHGVAVVMDSLVTSDLTSWYQTKILDIADRWPGATRTIGKFSISNALQAVWNSFRLFWLCFRFRPDVVYLFISQGRWGFLRDSLFIRIARLFKAKIIANLGGAYFRKFYESQKPGRQKRIRRTLNRIDLIQVLGGRLKEIFKDLVPEERVTVTPNGIDITLFAGVAEQRRKRPPGKNILYLSSMIVGKGVVDLVEAFAFVAQRHGDAVLHLVGPWTRKRDPEIIRSAIEKSIYKDRIRYHGILMGDEKLEMFAKADVFALPSRNEGQPVVLLEAMASGLPIITCERGVVTDMVVDKRGGFVVPPHSPKDIADAVSKIFDSPELAAKFSEFNVARVEKMYSMEIFAGKNRDDIESVL